MPVPPGMSPKDANQVLRAVMDDVNNRLRVDAVISPSGHDLEIHYQDDSIAIGDPATDNILGITSNHEAKVAVTSPLPAGTNSIGSVTANQGTSPWIISGSVVTSPNVNVHDGTGVSISSTGSSLNVDVTNTVPVSQSGTWIVQPGNTPNTTPWLTTINQGGNSATVTAANALKVDGSAVIQPVSGTVSTTQGTTPWVDNISQFGGNPVVTGTGASGAGIPRVTVSNDSNILATQSGTWNINNVTGTVSLPTGASTSALQTTGNTSLATIATTLTLPQGSTTAGQTGNLILGAVTIAAPTYTTGQSNPVSLTTSGAVRTDSSGTTQPVSGTVTTNQGTSPWVDNISQFGGNNVVTGTGASGVGIPRVTVANDSNILATQSGTWNINNVSGTVSLPTGAATSANQTNGSQKTQVVDGSGTVQGPAQTISGVNYMPVVLASSATPGSAVVARSIQVAGSDGTNAQTLSTDNTGKLNINNISGTLALPTGAATAANQTTGNTSLSSIDGKLTHGQTTAPNSVPVVAATWSYNHKAGAGTTTVKTGAGVFHSIAQNAGVGTTTIYDNTAGSGTVIAVLNNSGGPTVLVFDVAFTTGLTVVTTNGANDVTVMYN